MDSGIFVWLWWDLPSVLGFDAEEVFASLPVLGALSLLLFVEFPSSLLLLQYQISDSPKIIAIRSVF